MKLANLSDKEKIPKVAQDKRSITCKGRNIELPEEPCTETWLAKKSWHDILRVLNEEYIQPRIFYLARRSFKIGEIKIFQDKQKPKEFIVTKPALQEILKVII